MLGRYLLLSPLLLVLPPRSFQQAGGRSEPCPNAPGPSATGPASERAENRLRPDSGESFWSRTSDGAYSAPNGTQDLRSRISSAGLEVFPEETAESGAFAPWRLLLRTFAFGSENDVRPLGEPKLARVENRIDVHYAALSEWYVNDEQGIEQGWTIPTPPPLRSSAAIRIEIAIRGLHAEITGDGRSAVLVDDAAKTRLSYHGLRAWDALGRELTARMLPTPGGLAIHVEDENARYPITVDPVLSGPAWTTESDQANAFLGASVSGAGDVNGDGFADVIVGAADFDNGELNEGRAFLYLGTTRGLSLAPSWTAESDQIKAYFGTSVAGAGDVNGDGFDDVIVGAYQFDNGQSNEGRAYVYLGSAVGPSLAPDWTAESDQANAYFGWSVSGAGDVNGDGFDDVIVGAYQFDNGQSNEGRAYVYLGSAVGLSLSPDWTAESDQVDASFGWSVSGAEDVNGDGFDDVIVGADRLENGEAMEGRASLYLGSAGGLSLVADWTAESDQVGAFFGYSVSGAGDVDGDGFDDLLVGAVAFDHRLLDEGRAFLYLGSVAGPSLAPDWTAESDQFGSEFGWSVASAGDVDHDGFDDVILGAQSFENGQASEGRTFLYPGSAGGPALAPDWTAESNKAFAHFGSSVSGAGDVDGDGFDDVIVGAPGLTNGQPNEGRAYVYLGCEPAGTTYCIATANSTGAPAKISAWCSTSSAAGELELDATPVPNHHGIFFHGASQVQIPYGNGFLCVGGAIQRGAVLQVFGNFAAYTYDNSDPRHSLGAFIGSTRNFQYWFRDPAASGSFFNTSNAVAIAIQP